MTKWYAGGALNSRQAFCASALWGVIRKQATIQSIINSMSEQFGLKPRANGFDGLNNNAYKEKNTSNQ